MKKIRILSVGLVAFYSLAGFAAGADPKAVVETIFSKAATQNVGKNSKLQDEINRNIDFSEMAKTALGAEFKNRTPEQVAWFDATLKEIITRTVYPEAPNFLKAVKISYKTVKAEGEEARVSSIVKQKGDQTEVSYKLKKFGDSWRVVDVAIDGESWVSTISEQVKKTLAKSSWSGLEDRLKKRLASLRSGSKVKSTSDSDL